MDLVRLAYYPFLPEAREAVRELGPDMESLLTSGLYEGVRKRALGRLEAALEGKPMADADIRNDRSALAEIMSVPVARMLSVLLNDRTLIMRYADAEGRRLEATLFQDAEGLPAVLDELKVGAEQDGLKWRIHFSDYLKVAPVWEADWKLISQPVAAGYIQLNPARLAVLCGKALSARIKAELEEELSKPVHASVQTALQSYVDHFGPKLEEARKDWNTGDFGPVQDTLFPPCIAQIFQDMVDGKMIAHHARFAIASFLGTIGMNAADIQTYFSTIPNFDADKSRYQITHIVGEQGVDKYTPPGCATMQTNGVCPLEKRDNLCMKIKHPLSYYRAKIRFQKQDEEKAAQLIEQAKKEADKVAP